MQRLGLYLSMLLIAGFGIGFYGCSKPSANSSTANTPTDETGSHDDHDGHNHSDNAHSDHGEKDSGETAMDKMEKGLAGLSETDRESAMKQHFCPVSGEMLGTMGEPIKVSVQGQEVWICCNGCKKDLLADPDKYLAKLKK